MHALRLCSTLLCVLVTSPAWGKITLTGFGQLGGYINGAYGLSANGAVAVGEVYTSDAVLAFAWSREAGMASLGDLPGGGFTSRAYDASNNGSIVGFSWTEPGTEAFRWTPNQGMVGLGDLPGGNFFSEAWGISDDGRVIVGRSTGAAGREAFRWTQETGMIGLGDLTGGNFQSYAYNISGNGEVIVGTSLSAMGPEAFRWTEETGMVGLGDIPGNAFMSSAYAASFDGTTVVGNGHSPLGLPEAFRWTAETGMVGLGYLPGDNISTAYDVSGDGELVVGHSGQHAFIWDEVHGMRNLQDLLEAAGVDMTDWHLTNARGISADGRYVVASGYSPLGTQGCLIDFGAVPEPSFTALVAPLTGLMPLLRSRRGTKARMALFFEPSPHSGRPVRLPIAAEPRRVPLAAASEKRRNGIFTQTASKQPERQGLLLPAVNG